MAIPALGAVAFALGSAVLWGLSPVAAKRGLDRGGTSVQAAFAVILTTGALVWAALLATSGTAAFAGLSAADVGIFLLGGVIGTTLGRLAHYGGVRRVGASVETAVLNTRPLFAVGLAGLFLGEVVTLVTVAGVVLIVVGVIVLSLSRGGDIRGWEPTDLAFPIAAALSFGAGNVIRRWGFLATPASTLEALAINEAAAMVTLGGYLAATRSDQIRNASRGPMLYFALAGVISTGGLFALFQALSLGAVSLVDPVTGTAPLFAALFSALLLRDVERVTPGVVGGALLIVVGGALVTMF